MRTKQYLKTQLTAAAEALGLHWPERAVIETPKDPKFGDLACNIAMLLAKDAARPPAELARDLAQKVLSLSNLIIKAEPAGPGFINITFSPRHTRGLSSIISACGKKGAMASIKKG